MSNKNAIVIVWEGKEIPDQLTTEICRMLFDNKITYPEMLTCRVYDAKGISDAIIRDITVTEEKTTFSDESAEEAVKKAIVFIGERFEASLADTKNSWVFAFELRNAVCDARRNIGFNILSGEHSANKALLNAVEIIATKDAMISASFAKKYHITQVVVDIIKNVYESVF